MGHISELTFGSKLDLGRKVLSCILGFDSYDPPREEENAIEFSLLLDRIQNANNEKSLKQEDYSQATYLKYNAFKGKGKSVMGVLKLIRSSIIAQYGTSSTEYELVMRIIRVMRVTKLSKSRSDKKVDVSGDENDGGVRKKSMSQRSYGSMLGYFTELIVTIENYSDYKPSNEELSVASLFAFVEELKELILDAGSKQRDLHNAIYNRQKLYDDLKERILRIKNYVKSHYGENSNEYEILRTIKVW